MQSQAFEAAYQDAKATAERNGQSFDEEKAFKYAFAVSLQNAVLEKAGIDAALGKWMKAGGEKTLREFLKRVGTGAVGEGLTETISQCDAGCMAGGVLDAGGADQSAIECLALVRL